MNSGSDPITGEFAAYRRLLANKYSEIDDLLDGLPTEALLWKPFEGERWGSPSGELGWIIAHAISSTVYLFRRAEWQMGKRSWDEVDGDEGEEEFGPDNHDPAYLRARAIRSKTIVFDILDGLSVADLDATQPNPRAPERPLTARMDIQHAIEHMSQHIGHAQLTRQLWSSD